MAVKDPTKTFIPTNSIHGEAVATPLLQHTALCIHAQNVNVAQTACHTHTPSQRLYRNLPFCRKNLFRAGRGRSPAKSFNESIEWALSSQINTRISLWREYCCQLFCRPNTLCTRPKLALWNV